MKPQNSLYSFGLSLLQACLSQQGSMAAESLIVTGSRSQQETPTWRAACNLECLAKENLLLTLAYDFIFFDILKFEK
jgi:hypothetical protein